MKLRFVGGIGALAVMCGFMPIASAYTKVDIKAENAVVEQGTTQVARVVVTLTDNQGRSITTGPGSGWVPHIDASRIGVPSMGLSFARPAGQCSALSSRAVEDPSYKGTYRFDIRLQPGAPSGCTASWKRGKTFFTVSVYDPSVTGYMGATVFAVEAR